MDNKIQQLTEKLYHEGLSKGKQEAGELVEQAKTEADRLIADARKKAGEILSKAETEAAELTRNTASEIAVSSQQAVSDLRRRIELLITANSIAPQITKAFEDDAFVRDLMLETIRSWNMAGGEVPQLNLIVPAQKLTEFEQYIRSKIGTELNAGISFTADNKAKTGFKIQPADNGYYISVNDQDFGDFFKEYLRPKVNRLLFKNE